MAYAFRLTLSESASKFVLSQATLVYSKKAEGSWHYILQQYQQIALIFRPWVSHVLSVFLYKNEFHECEERASFFTILWLKAILNHSRCPLSCLVAEGHHCHKTRKQLCQDASNIKSKLSCDHSSFLEIV